MSNLPEVLSKYHGLENMSLSFYLLGFFALFYFVF